MRAARVTAIEVKDGWAALGTLRALIARDDPMELRRFNKGRLSPAEIHAYVQERVHYIHGPVQRWATPRRTLEAGFGDCGNSARAVIALSRFHGYPARLRVFTRTDRAPGIIGRSLTSPVHVAAQIADRGAWRWAECVIPASYGEHPLVAAHRLGMKTTIDEVPAPGEGRRGGVLPRPIGGPWPFGRRFPERVTAIGRSFTRARGAWPFYRGVMAQYREDVPRQSLHLHVMQGGRWVISHADAVNPDRGSHVEHLIRDVVLPMQRIGAMQIAATPTPVTPADQYQALADAWYASRSDAPTKAQLLILLAQWALETG